MSTDTSYLFSPSSSSGERYHSVTTLFDRAGFFVSSNRERPKSATLSWCCSPMSRFELLMSLRRPTAPTPHTIAVST